MSDLATLWGKLEAAKDSKSLLKKHLTKEIYEQLKDKKTSFGGTLAHCIRSGKTDHFLTSTCHIAFPVHASLVLRDSFSLFAGFFTEQKILPLQF